jgi:hypothetical protein
MSHVIGITLVIKDLHALEQACKDLGLTFVRDQKTHAWFGRWVNDYSQKDAAYKNAGIKPENYGKCEHAIKVPGSGYEIGVYNNPQGKGFILAYDNYGTGQVILQKLGSGLEKLKQAYGVAKATIEAKAKGWIVSKQTLASGSVKLVLTGV